jgi:hypothetical protein
MIPFLPGNALLKEHFSILWPGRSQEDMGSRSVQAEFFNRGRNERIGQCEQTVDPLIFYVKLANFTTISIYRDRHHMPLPSPFCPDADIPRRSAAGASAISEKSSECNWGYCVRCL